MFSMPGRLRTCHRYPRRALHFISQRKREKGARSQRQEEQCAATLFFTLCDHHSLHTPARERRACKTISHKTFRRWNIQLATTTYPLQAGRIIPRNRQTSHTMANRAQPQRSSLNRSAHTQAHTHTRKHESTHLMERMEMKNTFTLVYFQVLEGLKNFTRQQGVTVTLNLTRVFSSAKAASE